MSHARTESLAVPTKTRGHRHRRSAAISLDWRHVALPSVEPPTTTVLAASAPVAGCSPTLTFASTLSDTSLEEDSTPEICSTQNTLIGTPLPRKRVTFRDDVREIPSREAGDTWMKAEDYSWPINSAVSKTVLLDPLEPSIDLAAAQMPQVPGSPVLMHRKKRSSFLQSTKNALTRRPSKKRSPAPSIAPLELPIAAPRTSMIDLDLALAPQASLRHKKSGSLGIFSGLPSSPSKPRVSHKRADSAPADIIFSFSPRPASPDSRKRKMSSILEHPGTPNSALEVVEVRMDTTSSYDIRRTTLCQDISDDMIFGEPGDLISVREDGLGSDSPAVLALREHSSSTKNSKPGKKGWKGVLHRLLH